MVARLARKIDTVINFMDFLVRDYALYLTHKPCTCTCNSIPNTCGNNHLHLHSTTELFPATSIKEQYVLMIRIWLHYIKDITCLSL